MGLAVCGCCFRGNHSYLLLRVVSEAQGKRGSLSGWSLATESPPRGKPQLQEPQGLRKGGRVSWASASTRALGQPPHLKSHPYPVWQGEPILRCEKEWISHRSLCNKTEQEQEPPLSDLLFPDPSRKWGQFLNLRKFI